MTGWMEKPERKEGGADLGSKVNYPDDKEAREMIVEAGRRMYAKGYVVSNDGNITCKCGPDTIWATPTGQQGIHEGRHADQDEAGRHNHRGDGKTIE